MDAHSDAKGGLPPERVDPHPSRLALDHPCRDEILARHRAAIAAGEALYPDPQTGLWVMTAATLWKRDCCDNRCRHCPWIERDGSDPSAP